MESKNVGDVNERWPWIKTVGFTDAPRKDMECKSLS